MELYGQTCDDQCFVFQQRSFYDYESNYPLEMINNLFSDSRGIDRYFDESLNTDFLSQEDLDIFNEVYAPLRDEVFESRLSGSLYSPVRKINDSQEEVPMSHCLFEEEEGFETADGFCSLKVQGAYCKAELPEESQVPAINCVQVPPLERKGRTKNSGGQPSKNLMAERRRRKRLNDRLSMLRSIVPKISKMDRTSILGDTIIVADGHDYINDLLQNIDSMQHKLESGPNQLSILNIVKDMKPNEMFVRNSPKFNIEKKNEETNIEVCCAMKPGLVLSTVNKLESLGLEIDHCVISCFSDFAMQASCSHQQGLDQMLVVSAGNIKQALLKNAGYGGRCL